MACIVYSIVLYICSVGRQSYISVVLFLENFRIQSNAAIVVVVDETRCFYSQLLWMCYGHTYTFVNVIEICGWQKKNQRRKALSPLSTLLFGKLIFGYEYYRERRIGRTHTHRHRQPHTCVTKFGTYININNHKKFTACIIRVYTFCEFYIFTAHTIYV